VPVLCGVMTGEHLYLDIGMAAADTAVLTLALKATTPTVANAMRTWSIKTSQIPCWAPYRAPDGCQRYFMQAAGQIVSPNFSASPSGTSRGADQLNPKTDLLSQHIKTCIRREKGMCCTLFQVCTKYQGIDLTEQNAGANVALGTLAVVSEAWSFDFTVIQKGAPLVAGGNGAIEQDAGLVDLGCSMDYVEIPDSGPNKNFGAATQVNTRYCGPRFGHVGLVIAAGAMSHTPIWDCTEPWEVTYHTNKFDALGAYNTAIANVKDIYRGMCLEYQQEAC